MQLTDVVEKFAELRGSSIGHGPKHPLKPNKKLQYDLDRLLQAYPFLRKDADYITFLELYGGAAIDRDDGDLVVHIFGIDEAVTLHLLEEDTLTGSPIDANGFFLFCSSVIGNEDSIGMDYAFDSTGLRKWGVYKSETTDENTEMIYEWHSETFIDWLAGLVRDMDY